MRSLRVSLILGTCLGTAGTLALADTVLFLLIREGVISHFDRSLIEKARAIAGVIDREDSDVDLDFGDVDMGEFTSADRGGFLQIWDADGKTLYRSASLAGGDLSMASHGSGAKPCAWVSLPSAKSGRVAHLSFLPGVERGGKHEGDQQGHQASPGLGRTGSRLSLALARDAGPIKDALAPVLWILVAVGVLTIAVTSVLLWRVVRRALRPVGAIAGQIARMGARELSERIEPSLLPEELQPVVRGFNELLGRLSAAFQREKRFSSDVAHELRTPLAGLRTTVEVALSRPRGADEYGQALSESLPLVKQMQAMVADLLALARLESGQVRLRRESVPVKEFLLSAWQGVENLASKKELKVHWHVQENATVMGDPSLLAIVGQNVLDNAVTHAADRGAIEVEAHLDAGDCVICVANTCTLRPDEVAHVFDRYWRADSVRRDAGVHSGLGLSLVKTIVEAMGGAASAEVTSEGRFHLVILLPAG